MKPLIVLLVAFIIATIALKLISGYFNFALAGKIAMSAMLLFTALGHLLYTRGMILMLPQFIPFKKAMVLITGLLVVIFAVGMLTQAYHRASGYLLILFFITILPANINAAVKNINYQKGTNTGSGLSYLWFRVPLQLFFIVWVYVSTLLY